MRAVARQAVAKFREWGLDNCLSALAGLLAFLLVIQGARCVATRRLAHGLVQSLKSSGETPPSRDETTLLAKYDAIAEKGILGSMKKVPPPQLFGIMADSALFGTSPKDAKLYEVGAQLPQGETIIEIGTDKVILEKESKQRTVTVFDAVVPVTKPPREATPAARVR